MTNVTSCSLGPGCAVGENGKKQDSKENILASQVVACGGERGRETFWRRTFDAAVHALIGQSFSRWKVRGVLTVSRSFNITLLQLGERFFKTRISRKQRPAILTSFSTIG